MPERLQKWKAYKKAGTALIDSSQEGRVGNGQAPNTIYNGYDDTVKAQAIQAIQIAIEAVEATASSITGVFRERLNGIEQRDAVTNIKIGANNSFIITKQYYQQMDLVTNELLLDALNTGKRVYKNGLTGTIILGDKLQKIFTASAEYFTLTDHDVHIDTTTNVIKDMEYIKQIIPNFIQSGSLSPEIIFEAISTNSLTDLKRKVQLAFAKQRKENNQLQQAMQKIQQLEQQLQEASKQLQKYQQQDQQLQQKQLQIEEEKLKQAREINLYKARTDRTYKEATVEEQRRRTDMEYNQMYDGNPFNDKIRQV